MVVDCPKCLECQKYNKYDYVSFSCKKYDKIPEKIINGFEKCKEYKKEETK